MGKIEIHGRDIVINGKKTHIRSGGMHYFRIHPDYWRDRIVKLRQCGLNTLETYLCWNLHEPKEGQFVFSGWLDFVKYVKLAQEEGLMVIIRPGGYICSEWDLGGMPSWLLTKPGLHFRCMNAPFLEAQDRYYRKVLELIKPLQFTEGGPVIMMQVENEYGSYGNDHDYIAHCRDVFLDCGINIPLFTSDGPTTHCLSAGTNPNMMPTVNGRNHPLKMAENLARFRHDTPPFIMELWCGIGLRWNVMHKAHLPEDVRQDIKEAMENQINFNLYMFHGGTNFGFMSGGNGPTPTAPMPYRPMMTSYDVDAPLDESGQPTEKYFAIQSEIARFETDMKVEHPISVKKKAYGKIELTECVTLLDALPDLARPKNEVYARTMEHYGQDYGFILYRYNLELPGNIRLHDLKDRAIAMVNGDVAAVIYRNDADQSFYVPYPNCQLDVLVENMGRINFSFHMEDEFKGIKRLTLDSQEQFHCQVYNLPLDNLEVLKFHPISGRIDQPAFYRSTFAVSEVADTYLRIPNGNKGLIWINGFNIGRYWNVGPQMTLYVPAPLLKQGVNEIVILELHNLYEPCLESVDKADFGQVPPLLLV